MIKPLYESKIRQLPLVIAHRGASAAEPEMTAAAYERAILDGADGCECDVRLSRDGVLVLIHDATIDRTTTGRGSISTLTWSEVAPLGLLSLDDLIDIAQGVGRPVRLSIETKHPSRDSRALEQAVYDKLRERRRLALGLDRIMSFSLAAMQRMHHIDSSLPLVYLFDQPPGRWISGALPGGISTAGISLAGLRADPGYVRRVKDHGGKVHVWTVNTEQDIVWCVEAGVDAVITNEPALARRMIDTHTA